MFTKDSHPSKYEVRTMFHDRSTQAAYLEAYTEGMQSGATSAQACPYALNLPAAWAWLDGLWASRDATRQETLAGPGLIWAVHDPTTEVYRSLHRYPGEAYAAAAALADNATVVCLPFNAAILEPDLNEEVEDVDGNPLKGHPMTWTGEPVP